MPSDCSLSVDRAKKVEKAPITDPSMMPTIGTVSEALSETRCRNRKKTIVPMKAKMMDTPILASRLALGKSTSMVSRPSPAHSVVPVVVGSTKRFWVSSCMTNPLMAMAAPASTSAMVRGMRVMANIWAPSSLPKMS